MKQYEKIYSNLNKQQKEAVNTIDGPVMIIAGPGTGKTLTLTMRIANILKSTDTDPHSILALTFTESGAKAMRERLVEIIGPTAYYVNIGTFHAFCSDTIKDYPETFLMSDEAKALSDLERIQIFRDILDQFDADILKPTNLPYFYIHDIINSIQTLKREGITPTRFKKILQKEKKTFERTPDKVNERTGKMKIKFQKQERELGKNLELLQIYIEYQKKLKEAERFDYEDMINYVVMKMKQNENFKYSLQEKFLYILVDEYQDTNSSQNELLKLLTDHWKNPNVFVVGDDEQSIYRFQGASLENILYFKKLFEHAKVITLTSNYRSSQHILDASRSLIKQNLMRLNDEKRKLKAEVQRNNIPIEIANFSSSADENLYIASEIKKLVKKGTDPDQIAILVRHNKDINDIKEILSRKEIRYEIASGKNILEDGDIVRLLSLLRVIHDLKEKPGNDIDLFTLLNYKFLGFDKLDILRLARFASEKNINILDTILDYDIHNELDLSDSDKFIHFVKKLNEWQHLDSNETFIKVFETLLKESGFLEWILKDKYNFSRINIINSLFDEVKDLNQSDHSLNLEKFLINLDLMIENNIKIEEKSFDSDTDAIKVLTAHKAKGLEFDHVFIAKCIDKKWGNNISRNKIKLPESILINSKPQEKEKNEDERRLFYVALTRARKAVHITYSEEYSFGDYKRQAVPSMFLSEIDEKLLKKKDKGKIEEKLKDHYLDVYSTPDDKKHEKDEEVFLSSVISNIKLSVTSLNNYLKCKYRFKLNNILRTPKAKPPHMAYGSAIHKSLELFFKKYKREESLPNAEFLLKEFEKALRREVLTEKEYKRYLKRGNKSLKNYYDSNKDSIAMPIFTEYSFGHKKVYLKDIPLTGKIDKVEWDNRDRKEVKVIDYKTGSPKSRGEIEGKTKTSEGDLFRQLLFYKLLSNLDHNFNYTVTKGILDFIEEKSGKKAKREEYSYNAEDIEDLKITIMKEYKKIKDLKFERTEEYRHCTNCEYIKHCWPDGIPNG